MQYCNAIFCITTAPLLAALTKRLNFTRLYSSNKCEENIDEVVALLFCLCQTLKANAVGRKLLLQYQNYGFICNDTRTNIARIEKNIYGLKKHIDKKYTDSLPNKQEA